MNKDAAKIVKQIIEGYFLKGKADKLKTDGIAEIKLLLKRYKIPFSQVKSEINPLIKSVELQLEKEFVGKLTQDFNTNIKTELNNIIKTSDAAVTKTQSKIEKLITKTIEQSVKDGGSNSTLFDKIESGLRRIKVEQRHIDTEIFTTKLALNNLKRSVDFKAGGVQYLRYVGPSGTTREFCAAHIDKVYSLGEVENMQNNFGQPALVYCGGYNCRHRWAPVFGEEQENVFVDESWNSNFAKANKNDKVNLQTEKDFAVKLGKQGYKMELNHSSKNVQGDTDLIFEGKFAQLKTKTTNNYRGLERALADAKNQADVVMIDQQVEIQKYDRAIGKVKGWLKRHPNKKIYLFYNNELKEMKL